MSRGRRVLSMITASMAVVGLGFVVAVASSSRPGQADEPWLDVSFRADVDLTPVFAWIVLIAAVVGTILFALALKQSGLPERNGRRSFLGILLGLIAFVAIFRYFRPLAESVLVETGQSSEVIAEQTEPSGGGSSLGWIFSVLLAAVMAAALTRIGMSIRSTGAPLSEAETMHGEVASGIPLAAAPRPRALGTDPRSQILNAYGEFEDDSTLHGVGRSESETESRHARRAGAELGLDRSDIQRLSNQHADARYGLSEPSQQDAVEARAATERLKQEMGD